MDKATFVNHAKAWRYAEEHELAREPELVKQARTRAAQRNMPQPSAEQGTLLRTLAIAHHVTSAIIVGTSALVEAAQLIDALDAGGSLTAVDSSLAGAEQIRQFFARVHTRATMRTVSTSPATFLPRLNASDYDLIVVCGDPSNYTTAFAMAPRLLRQHGIVAFTNIMAMDRKDAAVFNSADRSQKTVAMRALIHTVEEDDRFVTSFSSCGNGVLLAVMR